MLRRALDIWPVGEFVEPAFGLEEYVAFKFRVIWESEEQVDRDEAIIRGWDMLRTIVEDFLDGTSWALWSSLEDLRVVAVRFLERHGA